MKSPPTHETLWIMSDDRSDERLADQRVVASPTRFRLAWRWNSSGMTGAGPWMYRSDVVEAWKDSLNQRHRGSVEHWVETSTGVD